MQKIRQVPPSRPLRHRAFRRRGWHASLLIAMALLLAACQLSLPADSPNADSGSDAVLVSLSPDASDLRPLAGQTVSGEIYLFVPSGEDVLDVRITIDDRDPLDFGLRPLDRIETSNFYAARVKDETHPWNTKNLPNGRHKIKVEIDTDTGESTETDTIEIEFDVDNPPADEDEPENSGEVPGDGPEDAAEVPEGDSADEGDEAPIDEPVDGPGGDGTEVPTDEPGDDTAGDGSDVPTDEPLDAPSDSDTGTPAPAPDRLLFGAWTPTGPWSTMDAYYALEEQIEFQLDVVHWYMSFSTPWLAHLLDRADDGGRIPMITWEAYDESLGDIASGVHDARLRDWARGAAAYGKVFYLRPFQEMNADFFPWGMDPTAYKAAWRHMVDVFRSEGAHNVRWIWSPNVDDNPNTAENKLEFYYPGTDYVDVLAIDAYNWGTCTSWGRWQSFEDMLDEAYARVSVLGDQPIWIAEFGSTESGGDKGQWIRDALASTAFPRIEALIYFDHTTGRSCDWDIGTSAGSIQGFVDALDALESSRTLLAARTP